MHHSKIKNYPLDRKLLLCHVYYCVTHPQKCPTILYSRNMYTYVSPENYRPISITATCCRVMEKIINESIILHLTNHILIDNNQHGSIPARSTLTNVLECIQQWTDTIQNKQNMDTIYWDFRKAFDNYLMLN